MGFEEDDLVQRIRRELADGYDEELELELEDRKLDLLAQTASAAPDHDQSAQRRAYFHALFKMQGELVKLQDWVVHTGHLLGQMPYTEIEHPPVELPPRIRHEDYVRRPVPPELLVPEVY